MKILYGIPSHKRADRVTTLKMCPEALVFVPESQLEDYKKHIPEEKLISHPDSIIGLTPKLNWMLRWAREHDYDVFEKLDDDFQYARWCFGTSEKLTTEEFMQLSRNLIQMSIDSNTPLHTCAETPDVRKSTVNQPFDFFTPRMGYFGLVLKGFEPIHFDERFILKQDFDLAFQVIHKYGRMVTDNRWGIAMTGVGTNQGGCADYRNESKELEMIKLLGKKWGHDYFRASQSKRFGNFTVKVDNPLFSWDI
jgi:hypothetical protein